MLRKACLLFLVLALIPCISYAEIKTYTHTVKQSFGGSQSPDDARVAAIHKAKREALEKAGTYLESLTIVKNSMVEKDEILALAAGVLKAEVVSQENFHTKDAFGIIVVAKVDVDTSILEDRVRKLLQDREYLKKYKESQKREKELLAKIARLEEENRKLSTSPPSAETQKKEDLKKQFRETAQGLTAIEWLEKFYALNRNAKISGKKVDLNLSLNYVNQAIRLDPNLIRAYRLRAGVYKDLKQYQRALEDHNQAIRLDPGDPYSYRFRGNTYREIGQYQRAIEDYNQAIRLEPNNSEFYRWRGQFYEYFLEQYQRAIEDYSQAIRLDPNDDSAYSSRGNAYVNLKQYQRAIEDYSQVIRLDSNDYSAYSFRGNIYRKIGQYQRAIEDYNQAIRLSSTDDVLLPMHYQGRGNTYEELGQYQRALEDYNQAIRLDPKSFFAYHSRGDIYKKLGQYQRAIEDYNQAIRLEPKIFFFYVSRGDAYEKLGQVERACNDWRKACDLGHCEDLNWAKEQGRCSSVEQTPTDIYKYQDENGVWHYINNPKTVPKGAEKLKR
ncbi:MAG: tetratricopeptide repeat protein [Desulfobacterales bacterium]|uniref:Tetratricopeptide repeat protein n=1 Tax=Candidatus Desulfatibia vada TaxID=2841696 RepID=A0A8J6NVC7_9BACT|nr:tetratricopeptide repeat protein [Candidatus Desulfatibia vada]